MMSKAIKKCLSIFISLLISSCSVQLEDYQQSKEPFSIKSYFNGNVIAWGMVQDYGNKVKRRFCVEIEGSWQDNSGVLAETFYFDDGEVTYRNWQLSLMPDGSYQGTAEDVVGIAMGKHKGFAFQFQYQLLLNLDNETYQVSMDDWMYQIDQHKVMNTTSMSKFGVEVAKITLFFDKESPNKRCNFIAA